MSTLFNDSRLPARFWSKVMVEEGGCWLWIASLYGSGYGQFSTGHSTQQPAHRVVFVALVGPVPSGLELDHLCRNRRCCNPEHLEPVTRKENARRGLKGVLHTHCPKGHEFTPENTALNNRGHRYCRQCSRDAYERIAPEDDKRRVLKAICKRGHVLANTAPVNPKTGTRKCLACSNQLQRERRALASLCDRDLLGA